MELKGLHTMKKQHAFGVILLLMMLVTPFISLAQPAPLVYAAVVDDNVFIYGLIDQPAQVTFNEPVAGLGGRSISHLTWSADGQKLAFIQRTVTPDNEFFIISHDVTVVDLATNVISTLGVQPSTVYPISFLPDGRLMFTQEGGYVEGSGSLQMINVFAVLPDGQSQPEQIGSFSYGVGCGGGSSFPTDTLYWEESGGFGGNPMLLVSSSAGIIHSTDCSGNGVAMLSPDGNSIPLVPSISRVKLSQDGNRLVGVSGQDLLVYDLMTQTEQRIDIESVPDQVAWGVQGTGDIFYSVVTSGPTITLEGDRLATFTAFIGYELTEIQTYGLNIRKYNMTSTDDTPVYGGFGSGIGRMMLTKDNTQLIFSQVPNPNPWIDAVLAGQLGTFDTRNEVNELSLLPVELVSLDLASGTTTVIGTNQRQVTIR